MKPCVCVYVSIALTVAPWLVAHAVRLGDGCTSAEECLGGGGLICTNGKCACQPKVPIRNEETMKCEGKDHDASCTGDECYKGLECREGKCLCYERYVNWDAVRRVCVGEPYGQKCTFPQACEDHGVQCLDNLCRCPEGHKYRQRDKKCLPKFRVIINGPCDDNDDCVSTANLDCIDKVCACVAGEEWIEGKCQSATVQTKCNPTENTDKCESTKNFVCDDAKVCRCAEGMDFSVSADACKLTFGQPCRVNGTAVHDLCLSQHCGDDPEQKEDFGKCACADVDGVRQIWSSELRCVEDHYDMPCAGTQKGECAHGGQEAFRIGLTCHGGRCACAKPFAYVNAYCLEAILSHHERCDERGIGDTCKREGTPLSCLDIDGSGYKCVCLPQKDFQKKSTNQEPVYTPLVWDAANERCGKGKGGKTAAEIQIVLLTTAAILFLF